MSQEDPFASFESDRTFVMPSPGQRDPVALRDTLAEGVRAFERKAAQLGVESRNIIAARYILCTFLDETAAGTPWGGSGVWGRNSLLVMFHNETWGGEKVFQLMAKL